MSQIYTVPELLPTVEDFEKVLSAKLSFEKASTTLTPAKMDSWSKSHFTLTPWGIGYTLSKASYDKSVAYYRNKGWSNPKPKSDVALRYLVVAVVVGWDDLVVQLKKTLKNWGYTAQDLQQMAKDVWQNSKYSQQILQTLDTAQNGNNITLVESVERHPKLNAKLFTKEDILKETVRKKMLEIVDEFIDNLAEQNIEIKIDDILLVGSNASYNYTKDSDIDLHIIANTKNIKYSTDIADALYSAYRSLFNKNLDINIYDIPLELYVETEKTPRNSNGVYSIKKDKWIKKPTPEDIPEYDTKALEKLVAKWEAKCKKLLDKIKANKLEDEKQVVKLIADIYDELRKTGVAKSEYAIENLAFKELRNKGYLDKLKVSKHELISKRLSLEERLDRQARASVYSQIAAAARHQQPIIQDNGIFYIYNLKESEIPQVVRDLKKIPYVTEASPQESGKYDFSNPLEIAMNKIPKKYYNIRGKIDETLI